MSFTEEICYLIAFPNNQNTIANRDTIRGLKDAPYFQAVDIDIQNLGHETISLNGVNVSIFQQIYDGHVQIIDCRFSIVNPLSQNSIQIRKNLEDALQRRLIPAEHLETGIFEEYITLLIQNFKDSPDEFINHQAQNIARFIRSQREGFDALELDEILISRVRYSKDELTLVDWEGAVILSPTGDFQSDIELLKIGNYQLLRYRMLDQAIENSLRDISREFKSKKMGLFQVGPSRTFLRKIVSLRLELMLDFEGTAQNLLLIGDWYTAKLYYAIQEEFYLTNWKENLREKLDSLEAVTETIQENFSLSWRGLIERVDLIGWIILLIGYFVLFYFDWIAAH